MTNEEAIQRLDNIDLERSNIRDRLAIHHAVTRIRRCAELEVEREKLRGWVTALFDEADDAWRRGRHDDYREARRDTLEDILDYLNGNLTMPPEVKDE